MARWKSAAVAAAALSLALVGCSSVSPTTPAPTTDAGTGTETTDPTDNGGEPGTDTPDKTFTIGVSNGFVGSEYRTQMITDIEEVAKEYQEAGLLGDLVIENADTDVNGQIQQVRNLINSGVDAIIINPNSGTALDAVFAEAEAQGILVFAIDQAVTTESVINVGIDQGEWAATSAKWLANELGSGANVVVVNGISGHPANEARWEAAKAEFDAAGVNVLAIADGNWDQASGQQQMSTLLATYPNINGVWTQDGMAQGILQALIAADKQNEIITSGEARIGFMRLWSEQGDGFKSIGVVNPPGTGGTALHIAMNLLQGKSLKADALTDGHNVVLPLDDPITADNFQAAWDEYKDRPDTYVLDSVWTAEQVADLIE